MAADPLPPGPDAAPLDIRLSGVSKSFGTAGGYLKVVDTVDLSVPGGSTLALVGPSGCGKSTILRMAAGLEIPDHGKIRLGDAPAADLRGRGALAVAFQEDALLPWRSLQGNVALARRLARLPRAPDLVADLIGRVGLAGFERQRPAALSGGMRQRAAIARCLATAPRVLLLDEPFGAVDALTRRRLNLDLPPLWQQTRATVLLVTHSVSEAVLLSDRVVVLSQRPARIVADITVTLPRPRRAEMLDTPAFHACVGQIEAALEQVDPPGLAAQ